MKNTYTNFYKGRVNFSTPGMKSMAGMAFQLHSFYRNSFALCKIPLAFYSSINSNSIPDTEKIFDVGDSQVLERVLNDDLNLSNLNKIINDIDIDKILNEVGNITSKGYVNSFEIGNSRKYPIFSKYVKKLLNPDCNLSKLNDKDRIEFCKWGYNSLLMDIYCNLTILVHKLKNDSLKDDSYTDKCREIAILTKEIYNKIDPSIRIHLKKSGVSFMLNTYTGYDTEYQNIDSMTNKLLSVQLAVSSRILLKLPLPDLVYKLTKVDSLKGVVYEIERSSERLNYKNLIDFINSRIKYIRDYSCKNHDESIRILVNGLKEMGIPYIVKGNYIVFMFKNSAVKTWFNSEIKDIGISLKEIVMKSNDLSKPFLDEELNRIYDLLKDIYNNTQNPLGKLPIITEDEGENWDVLNSRIEESEDLLEYRELYKSKKFSRTNRQSFSMDKIVVSIIRSNYLIGHLTSADLSMLNDFDVYKKEFDIVNGCFVTLKKPLLIDNVNLILRDTMLLAPGGKKSLALIGSLYNETIGKDFGKINIGDKINNMEKYLKDDYEGFKNYAIQDAVICLIHAMFMEKFNFDLGLIGIPLSLSALSAAYIKNKWFEDEYKGYQISKEYLIGDVSKTQTPKGLFSVGDIGLYLSLYIANYKGGRNESFMYGIDNSKKWFDYDLVSAYTTGMALLGDPDYSKARRLTIIELDKMSEEELILSYTVIKTSFKFPKNTKFPSIPCFVDKDTTVYPLSGSGILTGSEYLLAKEQGCYFKIEDVFTIPFKDGEKSYKPFYSCIKELQLSRSKYKKDTINNSIYKELGNSIYGLVVKGISNKMKFDTRIGATVRMEGNILSNPIIASWITSFIRSVLGEMLHNIEKLKGSVVSATTDGFITNLEELEDKLLELPSEKTNLHRMYRKSRLDLSENSNALEVKKQGIGIVSWTTRGQFSKDSGILAATGFQKTEYSMDEIEVLFKDIMNSSNKELVYIHKSLRSALNIFKNGGHVTAIYKDQIFRLLFDNKRVIKDWVKRDLLDSSPVKDVDQAEMFRFLGKLSNSNIYQKNSTSSNSYNNTYKDMTDIMVRNFVRCLLSNEMNLDKNYFKNYAEIVDFIKKYDNNIRISTNIIAQLKRRIPRPKKLIKNQSSIKFIDYILETFPNFDVDKFLGDKK